MTLVIQPVRTEGQFRQFVHFPWKIYRQDPFWVPPLLSDRAARLDARRNPFWKDACRELWIASQDGRTVGTIAGIIDPGRIRALGQPVGAFGFFDTVNDPRVAGALLSTAGDWLRRQGMVLMRGPYNLTAEDECGLLIDGFQTRPALLEAHTPPYYPALVEGCGFTKYRDLVARLYRINHRRSFAEEFPARLAEVAERARQRQDLCLRQMDLRKWDQEVELAWRIVSGAVSSLPEHIPFRLEDFRALAESFRAFIDPRLAQVVEVAGKPAGFALALPDVYEALHKINGRLTPLALLKLLWYTGRIDGRRHLDRISFKILMVLPEYQGRGVEALLTQALARAIWERGYREVDMSMTGEENEKSNRFQERLGFQVYRRYRIYQKEL